MLCAECLTKQATVVFKWKEYNLISIVCKECAERLSVNEFRE